MSWFILRNPKYLIIVFMCWCTCYTFMLLRFHIKITIYLLTVIPFVPLIRSQHYLKLPVHFKPSTAGRHAGLLLIQSETSGSLVIQLTGEALPWIHHLPSYATSSCWPAGFGWMPSSVLFIMGQTRVTEEKGKTAKIQIKATLDCNPSSHRIWSCRLWLINWRWLRLLCQHRPRLRLDVAQVSSAGPWELFVPEAEWFWSDWLTISRHHSGISES